MTTPRRSHHDSGTPPGPDGARSIDDLSTRLRALRAWTGLSYREVHQRVECLRRSQGIAETPSYTTVFRCLQPGRTRLDVELVVDIATVLLGDRSEAERWRQAHQLVVGEASEASIVTVHDSLPHDIDRLVGRRDELRCILDTFDGEDSTNTVVVSSIEGMAGIGKTTLAIHAAHELLKQQGAEVQLTVNLRGYEADRTPADTAAVLAAFLQRLGVPGHQIHALNMSARVDKYRQLIAEKRAIVVLDNAASEEQVRPLLPDSPTCRILVTSRRGLPGLEQAQHLPLDVLPRDEALDLLRNAAGSSVVDDDPETAASIAALVGHLPLALSLIGARMKAKPDWTSSDHYEHLVERRRDLHLDPRVDLSFTLSYEGVDVEQQRVLRLLALHPGRDCDLYATAALADTSLEDVTHQIAGLTRASLVTESIQDRYELHDLVRVFAANRARDEESPTARRAALTRLLDHYRHTAVAAMNLYAPAERHNRPEVQEPSTPTPVLADRRAATAWLDAERANLLAVAVEAAGYGSSYASDLSRILFRYLDVEAHHHEAARLHECAARVAEGSARANALTSLGNTHRKEGRWREALNEQIQAVNIFRQVGDRAGEARSLQHRAITEWKLGRHSDAEKHLRTSLDIARELADPRAEGAAQTSLGAMLLDQGRHNEALQANEQALAKVQQTGNRIIESEILVNLGELHSRMGHPARAIECLQAGLSLARELGNRAREVHAQIQLGSAYGRLGQHRRALALHQQSLQMARDNGIRRLEAPALSGLGTSLHRLGQLERSLEHHDQALTIAIAMGDRYEAAHIHDEMASTHSAMGNVEEALDHWRQALTTFNDLGSREAEEVVAKLRKREMSTHDVIARWPNGA